MECRLIKEQLLDGPKAMAYDEVAAETVADGGPATVRVYRWFPSCVTLGHGNDAEIVERAFCEEWNVDVTRRPTGGGAIYHDTTGDVAYSIIAPADEFPSDVTECYREFLRPVLEAFAAVDVSVEFAAEPRESVWEPLCYLREVDPVHDLVGPDGRKIAGNAQYRTREAVVQHGSLSFDANPEKHLGCFSEPPIDAEAFDERVCGAADSATYDDVVDTGVAMFGGYDLERSRLVAELEEALSSWADAEEGEWTEAERERADELVAEKYGDEAWIRDREEPTS